MNDAFFRAIDAAELLRGIERERDRLALAYPWNQGKAWCAKCGSVREVAPRVLVSIGGIPKCCGETMGLRAPSPDTREGVALGGEER